MLDYLFVVGPDHPDVPAEVRGLCDEIGIANFGVLGDGRSGVDIASLAHNPDVEE